MFTWRAYPARGAQAIRRWSERRRKTLEDLVARVRSGVHCSRSLETYVDGVNAQTCDGRSTLEFSGGEVRALDV